MKHYFTITAGRTGTAWLASFLSENLGIETIHEHSEINDFGEKMPDIRTMRNFNNFGNNEFIKNFWNKKFSYINKEFYAETNHTLCKCGLVENIFLHNREKYTTLILLARNLEEQCASYLIRNDFENILSAWSWYLHPSYKKKIIDPKPFMKLGKASEPLWYCYEMAARQEYYYQKYSNKIRMIKVNLEDIVTNNGAKKFYSELGFKHDCIIPKPKNVNKMKRNNEIVENLRNIIHKINVNMPELVNRAIEDGFSF